MIQVEACDAVFAIGYLEEDRIRVKGGTGYAVEKAKTRNPIIAADAYPRNKRDTLPSAKKKSNPPREA